LLTSNFVSGGRIGVPDCRQTGCGRVPRVPGHHTLRPIEELPRARELFVLALFSTLVGVVAVFYEHHLATAVFTALTRVSSLPAMELYSARGGPLGSVVGPSVFVGIEGEQMIGAATVRGAIHLLHSSHTPIASLLETTEQALRVAVS
jgi:hypothetical protein